MLGKILQTLQSTLFTLSSESPVYFPDKGRTQFAEPLSVDKGFSCKRTPVIFRKGHFTDEGLTPNCYRYAKPPKSAHDFRAGFKCVEALGRIIIRGPYSPSML